ncbi:MAG TPA: hypothetical protein DDW50_16015 [Firmicutes bacterium]|nr:hypothetical protein [Bacillota bacterium]
MQLNNKFYFMFHKTKKFRKILIKTGIRIKRIEINYGNLSPNGDNYIFKKRKIIFLKEDHQMFKVTKQVVLVLLLILVSLSVAFAEAPFDSKNIIDDFNANASKVITGKCLKVELYPKDRFTKVEKDLLYYPYYCAGVIVEWEGSYGQVYRDNVYLNYIEVQGEWSLDVIFKSNKEQSVLIQEPTKPLPTPPAAPTKNDVIKLFDNWPTSREPGHTYKVEVLSVSEPTMQRQGLDYDSVVYTYTGRVHWTIDSPSTKGLFGKLLGSTPDIWEADYSVTATYSFAQQQWENQIRTANDKQLQ